MKSASERLGMASLLCAVLVLAACGIAGSADGDGTQPARAERSAASDGLRLGVLREAALKNGLVRAETLEIAGDPARQAVGKLIFASPLMGLNSRISCQDCHLDQFGSTDGLPNAIGAGGEGHGPARMKTAGRILPRNVLPFWGRGSKGFETFFWDGRVTLADGKVVSQFGDAAPSMDPMIVAVHLPSVEVREMITDTPEVRDTLVEEDVAAARRIHDTIARRFAADAVIGPQLAKAYGLPRAQLRFDQVSDALAQFIRHNFRLRPTRLHRFVFDRGPITEAESRGGILFYGRGRCAACHTGPYFSDFGFHAVGFPQAGFGKNGFGIDEGRFNVTLDPSDRFLFRTPPLYNLTKTAPYSHSGSVVRIEDAIVAHFDPLRLVDPKRLSVRARSDLYMRLGVASREPLPATLTDDEVRDLAAFLGMLDF